jgi:hypothetical protein
MALTEADIQPQMTRRRPGQSALTTPRNEKDRVEIQSGTEFGVTLGTPIAMIVRNEDQRPKDYGGSTMDMYPRPSHADFTYLEKYGVKASSGGGRSSARETIGMLLLLYSRSPEIFLIDLLSRTSRRGFNSREIPFSCPQRLDSCLCLVCRSRTPLSPNTDASDALHQPRLPLPHLVHHARTSRLVRPRPLPRRRCLCTHEENHRALPRR